MADPEEKTRNKIRSNSLSGPVVQGRYVGNVRQYNLPLLSAVVGAIIVLVTGILVSIATSSDKMSGNSDSATSGEPEVTDAPIRLSRQPTISNIAHDKVIPATTKLEYADVLKHFSQYREETALTQWEWIQALGAVGVEESYWEFGLDGMRDHTVQIVDVRPVEIECGPALGGTLLYDPPAGDTPIFLAVDLDDPNPKFQIEYPNQPPKSLFEQKIDLPKGETVPVVIVARATKGHCRFNLQIDYTSDGIQDNLVITAGDRQFEVTGRRPANQYNWVYLSGIHQCKSSYRLTGEDFANFNGKC
ncbi:hypothetical protein [Actinophytocola sediminis]